LPGWRINRARRHIDRSAAARVQGDLPASRCRANPFEEIKIIAGQKIEFEDGGDCEILNLSDRELGFTVMEFK
jgi:hypothetical protein